MLFDIDHVPFSRKGRFLTLSTMRVPGRDGERALYLRCVSGGDDASESRKNAPEARVDLYLK